MHTFPWKRVMAVLAVAGCATAPPPKNATSSAAAIRSAEEVGARNVPAANLHLQLAQEQYDRANKFVKEDEPTRAKYMLMRAEADAEVALAMARESRAKAELAAINSGNPGTTGGAPADQTPPKQE